MKKEKAGIGIAGNQLGVQKRVIIVDVSQRVEGAKKSVMINPELIKVDEPIVCREGCMSIPDYTGKITRYNQIKVKWQDLDGKWHEKSFEGIEARCIQHEIDHLNGLLFIDRIGCLKTDLKPREL